MWKSERIDQVKERKKEKYLGAIITDGESGADEIKTSAKNAVGKKI